MRIEYCGRQFVARCTFDERALPKTAKFRWDPDRRIWWTDDPKRAATLAEYCDDSARAAIDNHTKAVQAAVEASRAIDADAEIPAPEGLAYLPFQKAGIVYGSNREVTIIGDEMGLGKTIQALGIVNADQTVKSVLVICPASLRLNWQREAERWLVRPMSIGIANQTFPETDLVIINYDILRKHREALRSRTWDLLVVDECHYLKNPKTIRTIEVLGKWHRDPQLALSPIPARRRLYLTGTPIVNRPIELWPILHSTGRPEWRNWRAYVERFCDGEQTRWGWDVKGASNLGELQEILRSTIMVRRLKKDVLTDLPAKRRQVIELPANGALDVVRSENAAWRQREAVLEALQTAVELAKASEDQADYEAAVQALREGYMVAFTEMSALRHETARAKVPYVVEHVLEAVDSSGKVVLFGHHKDVLHAINDGLREGGIETVLLTGDMTAVERQESVDRFQTDDDVKVFIGTIGAAGVGITLTAASHVVFAELDWVPGNMSQAEDRCHRIGQSESVLVQHLVLEDSLDARIAKTIVEKQDVIDRALDKASSAIDRSWGTMITVADAATRNVTRTEIDEEAANIPVAEIVEIHEKLRRLAMMCDGALSVDGAGFNKCDTYIGKSLAARPSLTPKQAALGRRLVHKYRRQLS
jgi:SNF2 family DNA or RNA helicase